MVTEAKFDPRADGAAPSPKAQVETATHVVKEMRQYLKKLNWKAAELSEAQSLFEEMAACTREAAQIVRRRMQEHEEGRCGAFETDLHCKNKFGPGRGIFGTINMADPVTHITRSYHACSLACFKALQDLERDRRMKASIT